MSPKNIFIGLLLSLFVFQFSHANAPSDSVMQAWVARYDGYGGQDFARALGLDAAGNIYITGQSVGANMDHDFATLKYDPAGNLLWVQRYDSAGANSARALAVDPNGSVYVTGSTPGPIPTFDMLTIKYAAGGAQIWLEAYDRMQGDDHGVAMDMDAQGNIYVAGQSVGSGGGFDFVTVKYDSNAGLNWQAHYNGPGNNLDAALAVAAKLPSVYVTGNSTGSGTGSDFATIKYDATLGTELWVRRYNGPANSTDIGRVVAADDQGNVYVTGESMGAGTNFDYVTIKYDANGTPLWEARYNGPRNGADRPAALSLDSMGNIYITGKSFGASNIAEFTTLKYDPDGNLLWEARFDGAAGLGGGATAMTLDAQGNIYITGISLSGGIGSDYTTVKYDPAGNLRWSISYDGPGNNVDDPTGIAVDAQGNVYVTGYSTNASGDLDFTTIKYTQIITALNEPPAGIPQTFELRQNSPNPFNPVTNVEFGIGNAEWVKLTVFDVLGRKVKTLVDSRKTAGRYTVQWDGTNDAGQAVASGIYLYEFHAGKYSATRKMLLVR